MSFEKAKTMVINEVNFWATGILSIYREKRDRLEEKIWRFRTSTGLEKVRIEYLRRDFLDTRDRIDHLTETITIGMHSTSTLLKSPKMFAEAIQFVEKNKKLVPKRLLFYPGVAHFEAKISIKALSKAAIEPTLDFAFLAIHIFTNWLTPSGWLWGYFDMTPDEEMIMRLERIRRMSSQSLKNAEQALSRINQICDNIDKKHKDAVRFVEEF